MNIIDFIAFKAALGSSSTPNTPNAVHDINQDGIISVADFAYFMQAYEGENGDCNGNGVADLMDLLTGTSVDADLNGLPDECVPCPADFTGDRLVSGADLGVLLGTWGQSDVPTDLNADGNVGGADLGILLGARGPCP